MLLDPGNLSRKVFDLLNSRSPAWAAVCMNNLL